MTLAIRLLGPVEIEVDGEPLHVDTRKAVALLAYLAATDRPHDREHLVDLLWPGYDEDRGRATLRRTLSALKSGIGESRLEIERSRVGLRAENVAVDLHRLRDPNGLHPHPEGESCERCLAVLHERAALHRGEFMQGFVLKGAPAFEDWQVAQNEQMRRDVGTLLDRLLDAAIALGRLDEAAAVADERIALDPLNEPTYRALMRIHAAKGERGGIVAAYRSLVATLDRELGVEPLEETADLYHALSRGNISPAAPKHAEAGDESTQLPFVGRALEWERLVTAYQKATALIVGIEGEPGIGKTRLAEEFVGHARSLGARTMIARSHQGESNVAYGVLTDALRELVTSRVVSQLSGSAIEELARLLPELDVEPAESPVASRFYEAVRSAFEEGLRGTAPA